MDQVKLCQDVATYRKSKSMCNEKLDESKIKWIILQKQKMVTTSKISETINVTHAGSKRSDQIQIRRSRQDRLFCI